MISSKESIPHLDFDLFSKDKTSLAKDTINAFHDYGFCVFFNHTIDKDLIANCLSMYQELRILSSSLYFEDQHLRRSLSGKYS